MWTRDAREWRHQSGVDAVGDVLEVFGGWREGRQRKVASVREWMQSWMLLRFCGWMERGTPEEGGIGPGRDSIGGYY